jgi:two-component system, response regulator YesN
LQKYYKNIVYKSFYKYVVSFFAIVIFSLMSYLFFYFNSRAIIKEGVIESGLSQIKVISQDMDGNFFELNKTIYNFQNDLTIQSVDTSSSDAYFDYYQIQRIISQKITQQPLIDDILLYMENTDTIVNKEGAFKLDYFFENNLYHSNKNKYYWRDALKKQGTVSIYPADEYISRDFPSKINRKNLMIMVADSKTFKTMRMVILIDASKITQSYGDNIIIFEENGEALFNNLKYNIDFSVLNDQLTSEKSQFKMIDSGKDKYYAFFIKSNAYFSSTYSNPVYYVKLVLQKQIFKPMNDLNNIAIATLILMVIIGIILSVFFSARFYSPIKKLVELANKMNYPDDEQINVKDDMDNIYRHLEQSYSNNQSLQQKNRIMQQTYKEYFYSNLIKGNKKVLNKDSSQQLDIEDKSIKDYVIITYKIHFIDGVQMPFDTNNQEKSLEAQLLKIRVLVRDVIELTIKDLNYDYYSFEGDFKEYITIVKVKEEFDTDLFKTKIIKILENDSQYFYVTFGISSVYNSMECLSNAYDEAMDLFRYKSIKPVTQVLTPETTVEYNYRLPQFLEDKRENIIKFSKYDELSSFYMQLLEYFEEKEIPVCFIRNEFIRILFDVLKSGEKSHLIYTKKVSNIQRQIEKISTKEEMVTAIQSSVTMVQEQFKEPGSTVVSNNSTVEKIKEYIDANFHEDLYLNFLAEKFKISSAYLSKIFKEHTGVNFSDFLNHVRLENAKIYLGDSNMKVKDIASKVGYRDSNTFIKTFKKYYDCSPNEYRKLLIYNEKDEMDNE